MVLTFVLGIFDQFLTGLSTSVLSKWNEQITLIAGIVLGALLGWIYYFLFGGRILRRSHRETIQAKDELIDSYKLLFSSELAKIKPDHIDPKILIRLKRFFRAKGKASLKNRKP